MSKESEALNRLSEYVRQREYEKENITPYGTLTFIDDVNAIQKLIKALEIIKENIHFETQIINGEETLVVEKLFFVKLPKEKRDLLKEVLL